MADLLIIAPFLGVTKTHDGRFMKRGVYLLCALIMQSVLLPQLTSQQINNLLCSTDIIMAAPRSDFFRHESVIIWGASSQDEDETELNEMIATNVVAFRIQRWLHHVEAISDILPDTEISPRHLTGQNIILVGTPISNPIISTALSIMPAEVDSETISLGSAKWHGDEVGLILRYPNPFDPAYQMLMITAPSYEALRYIPQANDYCVFELTDYNPMADRFLELAMGDFTSSWTLDAIQLVDNEEIDTGENDIPPYEPPARFSPPAWVKDGVMYEIFVRSFADSDGDGIGDLPGLIRKLDYLNDGDDTTTDDLGISVIWLMPIFATTSYHGYDVKDYYSINPEYGTNQDFQELLRQSHARGIRVITDMVLNHCSNQHPYFLDAYGNPDSQYDDWFFFTNPSNTRAHNWEFRHRPGDRGLLDPFMPAWNVNNPSVQQYLIDMCKYWIDPNEDGDFSDGIDGFRCDYVKGPPHAFWKKFRCEVKSLNPDILLLAENWEGMQSIAQSFDDEFDMAFDFPFQGSVMELISSGNASALIRLINEQQSLLPPHATMNRFINNHDMNRIFTRLSERQAKLSIALLLTIPHMPMLYYGDEIGMRGRKDPYDEGIRRPMEWCADNNCAEMTSWYPVWNTQADGISVEEETEDPTSILSYTRQLIRLRDMHPALEKGTITIVPTYQEEAGEMQGSRRSLCYLLRCRDDILLVVANLHDARDVYISRDALAEYSLHPINHTTPLQQVGEFYQLACQTQSLYLFYHTK